MAISVNNFNEMVNRDINIAIASNLTTTQIAAALTALSAAVTALSGVTHDRTIQDTGTVLNPDQP